MTVTSQRGAPGLAAGRLTYTSGATVADTEAATWERRAAMTSAGQLGSRDLNRQGEQRAPEKGEHATPAKRSSRYELCEPHLINGHAAPPVIRQTSPAASWLGHLPK